MGDGAGRIVLATIAAAVITGAAALGGTVVGGRITTDVERDRDKAAERGATRVLAREFRTAAVYVDVMLERGAFLPIDQRFQIELAPEDLQLVAGALTHGEWEQVEDAVGATESLGLLIESRVRAGDPSARELAPDDRDLLQDSENEMDRARNTLVEGARE